MAIDSSAVMALARREAVNPKELSSQCQGKGGGSPLSNQPTPCTAQRPLSLRWILAFKHGWKRSFSRDLRG